MPAGTQLKGNAKWEDAVKSMAKAVPAPLRGIEWEGTGMEQYLAVVASMAEKMATALGADGERPAAGMSALAQDDMVAAALDLWRKRLIAYAARTVGAGTSGGAVSDRSIWESERVARREEMQGMIDAVKQMVPQARPDRLVLGSGEGAGAAGDAAGASFGVMEPADMSKSFPSAMSSDGANTMEPRVYLQLQAAAKQNALQFMMDSNMVDPRHEEFGKQ